MLKNKFDQLVKPEHLFTAGIIIIPSFIFQDYLPVKWFQVLLFMLLSVISGKRVLILPNIIMASGIIFANLMTPVGEVLFSVVRLPVTKGAIFNGLEKSALLIGMIYISRFSVSRGFILPGRRGNILSLVFYYFEKIMEGEKSSPVKTTKSTSSPKNSMNQANTIKPDNFFTKYIRFNPDNFIKRIDRKIIYVHASTKDFHSSNYDRSSGGDSLPFRKTTIFGWFIIISIILLNWGLFLIFL
jgi:hypothetical protein